MNTFKKTIKIFIIISILSVIYSSGVFSQMPFNKGKADIGVGNNNQNGPRVGKFISIDDKSISILTEYGHKEEFLITPKTSFVRELYVDKSKFQKDDTVLVLGQPPADKIIYPKLIKILSEREKVYEPRRPISHGSREIKDRRNSMQGPPIGVIVGLDPLTVDFFFGETNKIEITKSTKLLKEIPIDPSELKEGITLRILSSPKQHEKEQKEAIKIIVFFERETAIKEGNFFAFGGLPKREVSPIDFLDSPFGFLTAPPQPAYLFDLDVNWMVTGIRLASWEDIEKEKGVFEFSSVDKNILYLFKNGFNTIVELRAINPIYGTRSGKKGVRGVSFPEEYLYEWAKFVEKLVERYDADGIDDAPYSPVVKNYQLIHELLIPGHIKKSYWRENPDKYLKFYQITYNAIRKSCSDCNLYFIGGFEEDFLFNGEKTINGKILNEDGFFIKVLKELNKQGVRMENFGFDYHYWSFWLFRPGFGPDTYRNPLKFINNIRKMYKYFGYQDGDVNIISKESGVNGYINSEREQALYLLKLYISTIAAGQKHLFWTSLVEYKHESELFKGMGLVHDPSNNGYSHNKLSYYTYKLMVEKLKYSDWKKVDIIVDGEDDVYAFKFPQRNGNRPVVIVWWDYFKEKNLKEKNVTLNIDVNSRKVTVTSAIPNGKNGSEFNDKIKFKSNIIQVKNRSISTLLGQDVLYIEEGVIPQPVYKQTKPNHAILR